jgi:myb proto-oncogene protein
MTEMEKANLHAESERKMPLRKGAWSPEEDQKLTDYIKRFGIWNWSQMPEPAGTKH